MNCVILLTTILVSTFLFVTSEKCQRRVCNVRLDPDYDDPSKLSIALNPIYCTHIILYRAEVETNGKITMLGSEYKSRIQSALNFKKKNQNLKTILAVRNLNATKYNETIPASAHFIKMYTTDSSRNNFIKNIIKLVREYNIEGVKIDTQTDDGGNKEKFTQLIKELKTAIEEESSKTKKPPLILSVGIPSDKIFLDKYYDVLAISKLVDMVDLATYSFHFYAYCSPYPRHPSPLYSNDQSSIRTIDFMARYVAQLVGSKNKINVGLSTSVHSVSEYNGCFGTIEDINFQSYYGSTICKSGYKSKYHDKAVARVLTSDDDKWKYFYDDPDTLRIKVNYVKQNGFGGVLLSFAEGNHSECKQTNNPLLQAVYEECMKN